MFKVKFIALIGLIAVVTGSCKKDHWNDLFKSTGPIETRVREISGFNKIQLFDKIDVYLTQGPNYEVKVEAGKNLHIGVVTEIGDDSTLIIRNDNKCNFIRSQTKRITVYLTAPHFYFITHRGVGTVRCTNQITQDTIKTNSESPGDIYLNINTTCIKTSSHGNGDLYVSGYTESSYYYMNGNNYVMAQNLTVKDYTFLESISVCDSHVRAPENGTIYANIWTFGNIYYSGNPASASAERHDKGNLIRE